jgi:hypothetical protein
VVEVPTRTAEVLTKYTNIKAIAAMQRVTIL